MNELCLAVVGALTALHAATWGGFKDSPFEGFRGSSFLRSVVLGVGWALLVGHLRLIAPSTGLLVVVGVCYTGERLATEWWKAILRDDGQSAYSIPMRLAVRGRTVDARLPRYAVGALVAVGLVTAWLLASRFGGGVGALTWWLASIVLGSGGWLTAFGGAWKDAPVEGFQLRKFFRSPVVATAWGWLLVPFTPSVAVLVVAAGGLSVATIETYKTYLAGGPPGKFAGKPIRFQVSEARERCRRIHGAVYGVLAVAVAAELLDRSGPEGTGQLIGNADLLIVLSWATCFAALVLASPKSATVEPSRGSDPWTQSPGSLTDVDIRGASS